jgi:hypothetical protein
MPDEREIDPQRSPEDPTMPRAGEEPEPDWAEEIRARRRARGERLREIFATFDEEPPRRPADPPERTS